MLKSIATSSKAEIRRNSKVRCDFSNVLSNIPEMNRDINKSIRRYEECQSLSIQRAGHIRSR